MNAVEPLLRLRELECVRDGRLLFSGLNLQLEPGELLSLQGANGAGKSTLLRCIAGLYPDFVGDITTAHFVYSGHKAGLCGALTTTENLRFLAALSGKMQAPDSALTQHIELSSSNTSVSDALRQVGLAGYDDVHCSALSAGQLRRVGLARLLISPSPLWLLDEPLTALDQAGTDLLGIMIVEHLKNGGGAMCATHQDLPVDSYSRMELTATGVALMRQASHS